VVGSLGAAAELRVTRALRCVAETHVKRTKIEFMIGFLDALRRHDLEALRASLDGEIVWQGLREEWTCNGADSVVDMFAGQRDAYGEIEAIELIGGERHAILHARGGDLSAVEDVPLPDGVYNLFAIEDGKVTRIDDYADRNAALAAAGLSES
jgi:ketosteroid isomerase-like protein